MADEINVDVAALIEELGLSDRITLAVSQEVHRRLQATNALGETAQAVLLRSFPGLTITTIKRGAP